MKLWTIQPASFYQTLQEKGIVYCDREGYWCKHNRLQYDWLVEQMHQRIGNPPLLEIRYPLWGWYQYHSRKKPHPPKTPLKKGEEYSVYLEIEIPDNEVVLTDFSLWVNCLNGWQTKTDKELEHHIKVYENKVGKYCSFHEYPEDIQQGIMNTWQSIFDMKFRDKEWSTWAWWNRSIQATFWCLKSEQVLKVEFVGKEKV